MVRRIEIFKKRKQLLLRVPTFETEYRFRLIGDNSEIISQSEGYTQKHNVTEVVAKYFPEWEVDDLTKDYKSTWGR